MKLKIINTKNKFKSIVMGIIIIIFSICNLLFAIEINFKTYIISVVIFLIGLIILYFSIKNRNKKEENIIECESFEVVEEPTLDKFKDIKVVKVSDLVDKGKLLNLNNMGGIKIGKEGI